MEEMVDDTLQMDEDEDLEEEADAEVDKVLSELTDGKLGQAGTVHTELPVSIDHILDADISANLYTSLSKILSTRKQPRGLWSNIGSSSMACLAADILDNLMSHADLVVHTGYVVLAVLYIDTQFISCCSTVYA